VTSDITDHGSIKVFRADAQPGRNFLEVSSDKRGLYVNAWLGGHDPRLRSNHYPPDGKPRGIGAALSDDDARALISFLTEALEEAAPYAEKVAKDYERVVYCYAQRREAERDVASGGVVR